MNSAKHPLTVLKVGGAIVEDEARLADLIDRFVRIGGRKVLVHGGGRSATDLATRLGLETQMVAGRRITDEAMLRVAIMVYGGLVNKRIVAALLAHGVSALGLTGADLGLVSAHRRPVTSGVDYGFVGDVDHVDGERLATLLEGGITPVLAPLSCTPQGQLLNTNADTIASATACALAPHYDVRLMYTFEKSGVLRNPADEQSVIPRITAADFEHLVATGIVQGGMVPKIENSLAAIRRGVRQVVITRATAIDGTGGTIIE